jgi:hypothetical protein
MDASANMPIEGNEAGINGACDLFPRGNNEVAHIGQ